MNSTDKKMSLAKRASLTGFGFVGLWIVGFCVFTLIPIFYTLFLSFQQVSVTPTGIKTVFIGWDNFNRAFVQDDKFLEIVSQYLSEMVVYVPVILVFALILALVLNTKIKGTSIFRTIFFLPVIISSGPVIEKFITQGVATITDIDKLFDLTVLYDILPELLADSVSFLVNTFILILWFSGVQILIFIAGMQKLDRSMYEAGRIDGAGKWALFWKLTLPALRPIILLNLVYTVVSQSLFSLNPIVKKISDELTNAQTGYGYSSAIAWIYFALLVLVLVFFVGLMMFFGREKKVKSYGV